MKRFKTTDRVKHKYWGKATIVRPIKSILNNESIIAYIISCDERSAIRPKVNAHKYIAFTDQLEPLK